MSKQNTAPHFSPSPSRMPNVIWFLILPISIVCFFFDAAAAVPVVVVVVVE